MCGVEMKALVLVVRGDRFWTTASVPPCYRALPPPIFNLTGIGQSQLTNAVNSAKILIVATL